MATLRVQTGGDSADVMRWNQLATYNAECSRGIVHTPEWDERMVAEQALFDREQAERRKR